MNMIKIASVCQLAKGFSVKAEKADDKSDIIVGHLAFANLHVDRDTMEQIVGCAIGELGPVLWDEQGAQRRMMSWSADDREYRVTGRLCGPDGYPSIALLQATLNGIVATPSKLGALVSGDLSWLAKGDEVEDLEKLLGKLVRAEFDLFDGDQDDLFTKAGKVLPPGVDSLEITGADGASLKITRTDAVRPTKRNGRETHA